LYAQRSINDVKVTLLLTIALVVMAIFLFLRNVSATVIPSLALPMSVVGTFGAMPLCGYKRDAGLQVEGNGDRRQRTPPAGPCGGGRVVSQLLTLFITPVFYLYMKRARGLAGSMRIRKVGQALSPADVATASGVR
jgi:multidrug efflux pump subunit AcrB